jgi:hypothetical protein
MGSPRGKERGKLFNYHISVSSQFNEVRKSTKSKMSQFPSRYNMRELIKKSFHLSMYNLPQNLDFFSQRENLIKMQGEEVFKKNL